MSRRLILAAQHITHIISQRDAHQADRLVVWACYLAAAVFAALAATGQLP